MKRFSLFLTLSLTAILVACGPTTEPEIYDAAVGAQRMEKYDDAIGLFERLIEEYPKSERVPEAYYALGVLYQDQKKDYAKAVSMYTRLYENYPDTPTAANAMFMTAFIQHNEMKDLEAAKKTYETFLEKYPDSQLVSSAQFELSNLGKDPAELFKKADD